MARNSAGKWVARAGATGHSRNYRGQTPVNWYAALVLIVVLGVVSVVWANYEYRHPASAATTTTQPTTSTTWYAGITFDVCGKTQPALASNATAASTSGKGIFTAGNGVITVAPKNGQEAGKNAVLGKFVDGYSGLTLTSTTLVLPSGKKSTTYKDGKTCPKGTPDAGKKGQVRVVYWSSAFSKSAKAKPVTGEPATLRFTSNQLITVGFVPQNAKLGKNVSVVEALLHATTGSSATTTSTSTTAPATTPSTTPTSITTTSTTTTTAATSSTSTTAATSTTATTAPPTTTTAAKK